MGTRKLSYDFVKKQIEDANCKLLSNEYINNSTKLSIEFACGHIGEMAFTNFKQGKRCSICAGNKAFSYNEVKSFIESQNCKLISKEYKNNTSKLTIEFQCGHIGEMHYYDFRAGSRCGICAGKKRFEYDYVKNFIEERDCKLISKEYFNVKEKLSIMFGCGHIGNMAFRDFLKGNRCSKCCKSTKLTYEFVKTFIGEEGCELISSKYINAITKLLIRFECGHENLMTFACFRQGQRCTSCRQSKGEKKIKKYLERNNIEFISQFAFEDCIYKNRLLFDFYMPSLNTCIEYNGEQHYRSIEIFGGDDRFEQTKIRDAIKLNYCIKNNINFIVISYQDFDVIANVLDKKIKEIVNLNKSIDNNVVVYLKLNNNRHQNIDTHKKRLYKKLNYEKKKSKYRGVSYNKGQWRSRITIDGRQFVIGYFQTDVEAAMAYNEIASDYFGWKAKLNIIPEEEIINLWKEDKNQISSGE